MKKLCLLVMLFSVPCARAGFFYIVQQQEAIIIQRLGKYHRTMMPGLRFKWPFIEQARAVYWTHNNKKYEQRRLDLREHVHDLPSQLVITKDNVGMAINGLVYSRVIDPKKAVYGIDDLPNGIEKLSLTTLRNIVGSMYLDETLGSRDTINVRLKETLNDAAEKWGVKIERVELREVNPPKEVAHVMEKQMVAERERRATILSAEGAQKAAILEADGEQRAAILRAQGEKASEILKAEGASQAREMLAKAEAAAIDVIRKATGTENPLDFIKSLEYIRMLPKMTEGHNNKLVVVPYEAASLAGMIAAGAKIMSETDKRVV